MSLKKQSYSAVRWTTLSMVGKSGLQFLQVIILARLLAPSDFGLIAIVIAVISLAQIFSDMGVSTAIIHYQEISQEALSSLYWLNVLAGCVLMLVVMLLSPLVAYLYGYSELENVFMVTSIYFVIVAAGQQLRVVAEKELQFSKLARIELIAALMGFIVAVAWAMIWPGVYALVAGLLVTALTITVLSWIYLACDWRPMCRLYYADVRRFLGFGSYMMGNNIINVLNSQADVLIGGRYLSATELGVYSLPRDLSLRLAGTINPILTRVGFPVMAKVQGDKKKLKSVYLKTIRMASSVNFPLYIGMAVFAPEAVTVIFGDQWQESVPILRILAIWGLLRSTGNPIGSLLFALGKAALAFKWNLILTLIIIPSLWYGASYGAHGIAYTMLFLSLIFLVPGWFILVRPVCGAGFFEYFEQMLIPLVVSAISVLFGYLSVFNMENHLMRLIVATVASCLMYIFLSKWINRSWYMAMKQLLFHKIN